MNEEEAKAVVDKIYDDDSKELIDLLRFYKISESTIMLILLGIGSHTAYYKVLVNRINKNKLLVNEKWLKREVSEIFHEIDRNEEL